MVSKYGIRIRNYQAGSVYQYNLGTRKQYDYNKAMFTNSLFLYFLQDNGLNVINGSTRDIICINFDYGSRSYNEELKHINKLISLETNEQKINKLVKFKEDVIDKMDLFDKKSADEIREIFYQDGVNIDYKSKNNKTETIHYKMLYRSTGKAKQGSCMFICDRLYDKAIDFLRMGIKLKENENAPIVEISAYQSLIASSIVDTIKINPRNILIVEDVDSYFNTNVLSVETDEKKHCLLKEIKNYKLKNTMFDGEGLIDESIFPKNCDGYILLRHHFTKVACFKTKIQKFFKDYYGSEYTSAKVKDMWGNEHYVKDIEMITTNNAIKWCKFDISYDYWCDKVYENGCLFGIVKTAHKSKLGDVQKMSYQMINSLDIDIMSNITKTSKEYIELLKQDNNEFLKYLKDNSNFSTDYDVLVALCEQNMDFTRTKYFRQRKADIIESYIKSFRFGKVIQNADNLVFCGSPYALLLHSVGESVEKDKTFKIEKNAIQCFTVRFKDGEYLAGFRSPFNAKNNMLHLHNVYSDEYFKYFDLGEQIIVLNVLHTDIQDRANGCDFDSDAGFITNQGNIVSCAKNSYINYPTIVNNVPKSTIKYKNTISSYALIDNKLSHAQASIGLSSNIAQLTQTYMHTFPNENKYNDYTCILSVLAQLSIDGAKRVFDIDTEKEIKRIQKDINIAQNGYPLFWKHVKDYKTKTCDFNINKINKTLKCPMNFLMDLKFKKFRSKETELPLEYFFNKFELDNDRRKSKKVEGLIEKYAIDLYLYNTSDDDLETYQNRKYLMQADFDNLISEIKRIYISNNYLGLMSWLIDRTFLITENVKNNAKELNSYIKNKPILLKILYEINPKGLLQVFSKKLYTELN